MKEVYSIDDLAKRGLLDAGCAKPATLAVIGHPIAHSASPQMHQAALDEAGIDERYIRLDIEPGQVGAAFQRMRALGFRGCNVTVPHKLEAMEHCEVSHQARALGAVNTICFDTNMTRGLNTDGPGFVEALREDFDFPLAEASVAVIGAGGGAGQAIATQCALLGVRKLVVVNRTLDKLTVLVSRLLEHLRDGQVVALSLEDPALQDQCLACDLIVNTSSVGLKAGDPSLLPTACLRRGQLVYDTIYQPPVTPLLAAAAAAGCQTANGLSMLVHQGALAFQQWFPEENPLPPMQRVMARFKSPRP